MKLPDPILTIERDEKVTVEQLLSLGFTREQIDSGTVRGEMKTRGPWHTPVSYRALVERVDFATGRASFWSARTLTDLRQNGYAMDGRVSLGGRKVSAFTSSYLFEIEDGRFFETATIFVRIP